jgi:hypothetical protein
MDLVPESPKSATVALLSRPSRIRRLEAGNAALPLQKMTGPVSNEVLILEYPKIVGRDRLVSDMPPTQFT